MQSIEQRVATLEAAVAALQLKLSPTIPMKARKVVKVTQPNAWVIERLVRMIREAGTAGMPADTLRSRSRFMRVSIANGNLLPLELAAAGVQIHKTGKGHWYYIPDFL